MNTFLRIDERLFELLKQDYKMQDIVLLSILLRKSELKKSDTFFISHAEFEKAFNLSPYQVRSAMKRLNRWVTVNQARRIGINRYKIHRNVLEADLQNFSNSVCNDFYFDRIKIEDTDIEFSELKEAGERLEELEKVSVTFSDNPQKGDKFFSSNPEEKISPDSEGKNSLKNILQRVKNFYKRISESAYNLLTENTELIQINKNKKEKILSENKKNQKNKNTREEMGILIPEKGVTSSESNTYLTRGEEGNSSLREGDSSPKRRRGRPPKGIRPSDSGGDVSSAENAKSLQTLGGMTSDEFRRLLADYWSRQGSDLDAFKDFEKRIDQTTLSSPMKEIIKTFVWWFPADFTIISNARKFNQEWFEPCLQFSLNPIPFQYFTVQFLGQWGDVVNPPETGKHYSMLTPRGSWAFMRKSIANYIQRTKINPSYDVYLKSPLPQNLEMFKEYCQKQNLGAVFA